MTALEIFKFYFDEFKFEIRVALRQSNNDSSKAASKVAAKFGWTHVSSDMLAKSLNSSEVLDYLSGNN